MIKATIHEAKTHLSRLIRKVLQGEEVIISKGRTPVAKLVALPKKPTRRLLGDFKGKIEISPDFDAPLEDFDEYQ